MMQFQLKLTATEAVKVLEKLYQEKKITNLVFSFDVTDKALNFKFDIVDEYKGFTLIELSQLLLW
jgi:predicted aldo/keto reductase-like oxidoreductase